MIVVVILVRFLLVLGVYCALDHILGLVVTLALRWLFRDYLELPSFDWTVRSISLGWAWFEDVRLEINGFVWQNPAKYSSYFVAVKRLETRFPLRDLLAIYVFGERKPLPVSSIEAEDITVNLERRKGELSLWAALGLTEAEGREQIEEAHAAYGKDKFDEDDFDDFGEDEYAGEESAHHGLEVLGQFEVKRLTLRNVKARVGAFLATSDTKVQEEPLKVLRFELVKLRKGKRRGLFLDELVWKSTLAIVRKFSADNPFGLLRRGAAAAADKTKHAAKSAARAVDNLALNATQTTRVRVNDRIDRNIGSLDVVVKEAKHVSLPNEPKPSTYVKLQLGKKGVKAKTTVVSYTRNPSFQQSFVLAPVESLDIDLRVQIFAKHAFSKDPRVGGTLKLPLSKIRPGESWYPIPSEDNEDPQDNDDDDDDDDDIAGRASVVSSSKQPQVLLALNLRLDD
ncbi:hypothetical protein CTAYLR_008156 [Chrysophaeum taylorii]|uniref:C2 domain-containing protein n=1 Tax=Chrysophaeum taylorii TaxID=2483200 RepID=A0AAD7UJG2_9STRA|nr:hypothetical protein CTAYLR_008156 [Chrysophaeum taylorii]